MDKEEKLKSMIYDDCQKRIDRSNNAQFSILQFLVSINLAFIGFYIVYRVKPNELTENMKTLFILITIIMALINELLRRIYHREHEENKDNKNQILMIFKTLNTHLKDPIYHPNWYIFHENNEDKLKGWTNESIRSVFIIIQLVIMLILGCQLLEKLV